MSTKSARLRSIAFALMYIVLHVAVSYILFNICFIWSKLGSGLSVAQVEKNIMNNSYLLTIVSWIISMIIYTIIGRLRNKPISEEVADEDVPRIYYFMVAALAFGCRFLVAVYYSLAQKINILEQSIENAALSNPDITSKAQLFLAVICAIMVAPYFEEVLFRGLVMKELTRVFRPWLAITLQALAFGVIHGVLFQSIFAFLMGIVLGILYHRTRSIMVSVVCHSTFNITAVFMQGELQLRGMLVFGIGGLLLCALSMFYILVNTKKGSSL